MLPVSQAITWTLNAQNRLLSLWSIIVEGTIVMAFNRSRILLKPRGHGFNGIRCVARRYLDIAYRLLIVPWRDRSFTMQLSVVFLRLSCLMKRQLPVDILWLIRDEWNDIRTLPHFYHRLPYRTSTRGTCRHSLRRSLMNIQPVQCFE